jgi:alpha-1,3-mannosyltransferase
MLIVHIVRQFAPSVGGLEDVVRELSSRQGECGFAVRVITLFERNTFACLRDDRRR